MTASLADFPSAADPDLIARKALAVVRPTVWLTRLAGPIVLAVSLLDGHAAFWGSAEGRYWLLVAGFLHIWAVVLLAQMTRGVTRAKTDALAGGQVELMRLVSRVDRLPGSTYLPVLALALPAMFVVLLAPAVTAVHAI